MKMKIWNWVLIIGLALVIGQLAGLYSFIPLSGLSQEGTTDPLYVASRQVNGWGSSVSYGSQLYSSNVPGTTMSPSVDPYTEMGENVGRGVVKDEGQLRWFVDAEAISSTQIKYTVIGIDMVLYGGTIGGTHQCWISPDLVNPSAIPGSGAGYYFTNPVTPDTNSKGTTINAYSFLTDDPLVFDENEPYDYELTKMSDFGWKKVKHLSSTDMLAPWAISLGGNYPSNQEWKPATGLKAGVIPTPDEINTNWNSYPTISSITCGDVYAFKKEYTITYNPNDPKYVYVAFAINKDLDNTMKKNLLTQTGLTVLKPFEPNLSLLYSAKFDPCGEDAPIRYKQLGFSQGEIIAGISYYSYPSNWIANKAYVYEGKLYKDTIFQDTAGRTLHDIQNLQCPTGGGTCNYENKGDVTLLYKQVATSIGPIRKQYLAKSDENYKDTIRNTYTYVGQCVDLTTTPPKSTPCIKEGEDITNFANVKYVSDLKGLENVLFEAKGDIDEYGITKGVVYPKADYEYPIVRLSELETYYPNYSYYYSAVSNTAWVTNPSGSGHLDMYFFAETDAYKKHKETYTGTECGYKLANKEEEEDQTAVLINQTVPSGYKSNEAKETNLADTVQETFNLPFGDTLTWILIGVVGVLVALAVFKKRK